MSFTVRALNRLLFYCHKLVGATWVDHFTRRIRHAIGLEKIGPAADLDNFILVSNHRSYFDLYVISAVLIRAGMKKRMLYPVRSTFFYDHPLGWWVNGIMSFWSMYPPLFRERKKAVLNHTAIGEVIWSLRNADVGVGLHPEGTRNKGDDPYSFLPAQSGVGRAIHQSRKPVLPVFINGLGNDLYRQVKGNFDGTGRDVILVFGEPIDFGELLDAPANAKTFRALAERTLEEIGRLGAIEREARVEIERGQDGELSES